MSKYIEIIPKKLEQDFLKTEGIPGVYVWGYYEKNDYFIPLYVGKSRNVYERLIQHYCRFKSGEYCIFNKHDLVDIYCDKQVKNPKKVYAPISFRSVYSLAINTNQEHIFMINNFAFRYI